jgi:hypothetical protein
LRFFHFLEIVTGWLAGTFHRPRFHLMKTGFFRQVMELKIQRKNPGSALWLDNHVIAGVASVMEGYWMKL